MLSSKTGSTLNFLTPWKRLIAMSPVEASTMGDLCRECETKPLLFQSNHFWFFIYLNAILFILMICFVVFFSVRLEQGTVTSLLEENGTVKGVQYKTKEGNELRLYAPLTVVCDGCFSNLRRSLCKPKVLLSGRLVFFFFLT